MLAVKRTLHLLEPFTSFVLYADLSKPTMDNRRQITTITKALQKHHIPYKWGFPTKLLIVHQGKTHTVRTLPEGPSTDALLVLVQIHPTADERRGCTQKGTFLHIRWSCPKIRPFWDEIAPWIKKPIELSLERGRKGERFPPSFFFFCTWIYIHTYKYTIMVKHCT